MHTKSILLFSVITIHFLLGVDCILRNTVADRCMHIEYNGSDSNSGEVVAKECSWSNSKRRINGNKDQWVELAPRIHGQGQQVTIRKVDTDVLVCIITEGNALKTGTCNSASSAFIMKGVQNPDQKEVFTLENPEGFCVTVQPGRKILSMQKCISNDSFQQWTVCRHTGKCDVEAFWSPRGIVFRSDSFEEPTIDVESAVTSMPPKQNSDKISSSKIIVSEILYYLQNKLTREKQIADQEDLILLMSSFYKKVEIDDGINVLSWIYNGTSLEGPVHKDKADEDRVRNSTPEQLKLETVFLVNLYKKVRSMKKLDDITFVSRNLSRVPGHMSTDLFLSFEKLLEGNVDNAISSLETVKNNFRLFLAEALNVYYNKYPGNPSQQESSSTMSQHPNFSNGDDFPKNNIDIDVRLKQ